MTSGSVRGAFVDDRERRRNASGAAAGAGAGVLLGAILGLAFPSWGLMWSLVGLAAGAVAGAAVGRSIVGRVDPEDWDPVEHGKPFVGAYAPDESAGGDATRERIASAELDDVCDDLDIPSAGGQDRDDRRTAGPDEYGRVPPGASGEDF